MSKWMIWVVFPLFLETPMYTHGDSVCLFFNPERFWGEQSLGGTIFWSNYNDLTRSIYPKMYKLREIPGYFGEI